MEACVQIDCSPGPLRPDTHLHTICDQCGIDPTMMFAPAVKTFGCWTYVVKQPVQYALVAEQFGTELTRLYERGMIRYASW